MPSLGFITVRPEAQLVEQCISNNLASLEKAGHDVPEREALETAFPCCDARMVVAAVEGGKELARHGPMSRLAVPRSVVLAA